MKKKISRLVMAVLAMALLSVGAGAARPADAMEFLKTSKESTGTVTRELAGAEETVYIFPVGTEFSLNEAFEFSVSSYDGEAFKGGPGFGLEGVYTLETPGTVYRIRVNVLEMGNISGYSCFVMADGETSPAPAPSGAAASGEAAETIYSNLMGYTLSSLPIKKEEIPMNEETNTVYSLADGTVVKSDAGKKIDVAAYYFIPNALEEPYWECEPDALSNVDSFTVSDWEKDPQFQWLAGNIEQAGGEKKVIFWIQTRDPDKGGDYLGTDMYLDSGVFVTLGEGEAPAAPAKPVPSDWAKETVEAAEKAGLVPKLTGNPAYQDEITREQFAELALSMVKIVYGEGGDVNDQKTFTDCDNPAVLEASAFGLVGGDSSGAFSPKQTANREQIAVMVARSIECLNALEHKNVASKPGDIGSFSDKGAVSSWAADSVGKLAANSIMTGTSDTTLSPKGSCTVEQSVILLYRVYQQFMA